MFQCYVKENFFSGCFIDELALERTSFVHTHFEKKKRGSKTTLHSFHMLRHDAVWPERKYEL